MVLFKDVDTQRPSTTSTENNRLADKLHRLMARHRRMMRKYVRSSWAREFEILRRRHYNVETIDSVLAWLRANIKGQYTPQVYSASSFRKKFPALQAAMRRQQDNPPPAKVKIGKPVKRLLTETQFMWPNGKEYAVEEAWMQISYDNYVEFIRRVNTFIRTKYKSRSLGLAKFIYNRSSDPSTFLEGYVKEVHRIAWQWDKWKGDLLRWVFKVPGRIFQERMKQLTTEYGYTDKDWKLFQLELGYEMEDNAHPKT